MQYILGTATTSATSAIATKVTITMAVTADMIF